jgi:hypothetical protein
LTFSEKERPRTSMPSDSQENGCWKNSLTEVSGEKQRVGCVRNEHLQHAQLGNGEVLRLVGDGMGKGLVAPGRDMFGHPTDDLGPG